MIHDKLKELVYNQIQKLCSVMMPYKYKEGSTMASGRNVYVNICLDDVCIKYVDNATILIFSAPYHMEATFHGYLDNKNVKIITALYKNAVEQGKTLAREESKKELEL